MALQYRPEIDGLRTVAVLSVMVYHLKIELSAGTLLAGGYLGVDVFFVLSGFLITKILLIEMDATGRFSPANFYRRRARRILPALLLVILVFLPVAWQVLLPRAMEDFAASLVAALGFYANVFWFYAQTDYGAQSGLLQPFLHTWSLAVEEQFYILFPIVLAVLHRRGWVFPALVAMIVAGLALAEATTWFKPHVSFYAPSSRAWELLVGALLAWLSLHRPGLGKSHGITLALPALGLAILLWALANLPLDEIAHPGLMTVPVIFATCLLIWFADPREPVTRLLSTAGFVRIGKLSYSLYLWHFPIFAFGRLTSPGPDAVQMTVWVVLTFALAATGYVLVEKPFRHSIAAPVYWGGVGASVAAVLGFVAAVQLNDGYRERLTELVALYGKNEFENQVLLEQSWSVLNTLAPDEEISTWNAFEPSQNEMQNAWFRNDGRQNVLIVGNSHAKDVFNALYLNGSLFPGQDFARFGMAARLPAAQRTHLYASPNFRDADTILIAPRYTEATLRQLPGFIGELQDRGKEIILVENTAEFEVISEHPIFDWYLLYGEHGQEAVDLPALEINAMAYEMKTPEPARTNAELRRIATETGVPLLSRHDLICKDVARSCDLVTPEGWKAFYDYGHWTLEGAQHFGARAAHAGWFDGGGS